DKDLENLKNLVIENAGMIPSNVAQSALMNEDPEQALQSIYPYLGQMQKLDLQLKRLNIASTGLDIKVQQKKLDALNNPSLNLDIKPDFTAATYAKRISDANNTIE